MEKDELVLTPGGWRPKSKVHYVEPGQHISVAEGKLRIINTETCKITKDLGEITKIPQDKAGKSISRIKSAEKKEGIAGPAPITNGWIVNGEWTNNNRNPISYFNTSWIVPPNPATDNGQTIFLFNGIQQTNSGPFILQPVLQWGKSFAGGGSFWTITNWYVDGQGGVALHRDLIKVNPGDVVQGIMTLTGQSGTSFSYLSSFKGYPNADLLVTNIDELHWANITLECYGLKAFTDYPDTEFTEFDDIEIKIGNSEATLNWQADDRVTDNGQRCLIISNNSPGGKVRLYYRPTTGWHHNNLTHAASAPAAIGNPAGYTWDVDKTQHVVYRSNDGDIHELWFNGQWNHNNLTHAASAPAAAIGDPVGYTWDVDKTQHVVYRGNDGDIHELWFNA